MERVVVTRMFVGIAHMQVCAIKDATDEEILTVCNRENLSGVSGGWSSVCRAPDGEWLGGKTAPVPCDDHQDRVHLLVAC